MTENNYVCPYCGKEIDKQNILFWETVQQQFTDNVRGDFLRKHGVDVNSGSKFPRLYYRVTESNVTRVDANGYPAMIEDQLRNAIPPEELARNQNSRTADFDDDFNTEGFERSRERQDSEVHNIPMRACPHCHCELPQQFGLLKTHHVAMFGGRAAGKTAYLVNLFQQLSTQLGRNNLGSVQLETESRDFLQPTIETYEREGRTEATPADIGLMPIVCHYKNRNDEAFITIYDIAGEGTGDPAYMANHKGIANCESILLMIDPNMFVAGAYYDAWAANHRTGEERFSSQNECCKDSLDSFLNNAGDLCREYSEKMKNVICVITKLDMMLESERKLFSAGDIELLRDVGDKHRDAVDLQILKKINDELNRYLENQHKIRIKDKLIYAFGKEIRTIVLGVSTSTLKKQNGAEAHFEADCAAIAPKHRIIEPFLVVLMYFGLLPARNSGGEVIYFHGKERIEDVPAAPAAPPPKPKKHGFLFWRKNK